MPDANTGREAEHTAADASRSGSVEDRTRRVDVGDHQLVLHEAGTGWPTVVLEAGGGLSSDTWNAVWYPLARLTHVVRYDRAGLGSSAAAPPSRTYRDMVADLHTLLQRAGFAGPYILVGHSMGGLLVRVFAGQYPAEVVGLVLIDAVHPQQNQRALALLPPERADESLELATLRRNLQRIRDVTATELEDDVERVNWYVSEAQAQALGSLDDLPLVVLTQGRPLTFAPDFPADLAAYIRQSYHPMAMELQFDLARLSSQSRHLLAPRSGHMIHQDEPELVVASIRELVEAVRRGKQPLAS